LHLKQYPVYLKKRDAVQIFSREVYTNTAMVNFSPYEFEITLGPGSSNYEGGKTRRQPAHVTAVRQGVRQRVAGERRPVRTAGNEDCCFRRGKEVRVLF